MKPLQKRICALALCILIPGAFPVATLAQERAAKEEVAYVSLAADGAVSSIYVVNAFDLSEDGIVTDYGNYSQTRNMSTDAAIQTDGDRQTVAAARGRFYYQGNMTSKDMPWNIQVDYLLDGAPIKADALAGKSGRLEIHLHTTQNAAVNELFFQQFVLQTTITLDADRCRDISADGATIADAGGSKLLTYMIMPGNDKEIRVQAVVSDFEMAGIQFKGIPLHLDIEAPDTATLKEKLNDLQSGIATLNDGAEELKGGTASLKDGSGDLKSAADQIKSGSDQLAKGARQLKSGMAELNGQSASLLRGSAAVNAAMLQMNASSGQLTVLADSLARMKAGMNHLADLTADLCDKSTAIPTGSQSILDSINLFKGAMTAASAHDSELDPVLAALRSSADPNVQALLMAYTQKTAAITQTRTGLSTLATQYTDFNAKLGLLTSGLQQLNSLFAAANASMQLIQTDGLVQLQSGIQALAVQYGQLDSGITAYTAGFARILAGYGDIQTAITSLGSGITSLHAGIGTLADGAGDLADGAAALSDGTQTLQDKTAGIGQQVDDKVNEMISRYTGPKASLVSFVSAKNTAVSLVQFVIRTPDITRPAQMTPATTTSQDTVAPSFWSRLLDLFRRRS